MVAYIQRRFFGCFVFLCFIFGVIQIMLSITHQKSQQQSGVDRGRDTDDALFEKRQAQLHHHELTSIANQSSVHVMHSDNYTSVPFHKHWDTNCSGVFTGNKKVIRRTNAMLQKERVKGNGSIDIPIDREVVKWTQNCAFYKRVRHYPTNPASNEEAGFPVAYMIVTHKDAAQVERLLRAIYQPQNLYCIHPDSKSPKEFHRALQNLAGCFENVFISSKIEDVQYAGYTRLLADINCMKDLTGPRGDVYPWKYVMNLCGQDFPLKTNLEIVRQLKAYKGHNDITGVIPPSYIIGRTRYHHVIKDGRVTKTYKRKSPPPHNLTIFFGNAYYAATRRFVEYVLTSPQGTDLLKWSNDTLSPDEHYWATLQRSPGAPGGFPNSTWDENVRFMKWGDITKHPPCRGKYVRGLCVFGFSYLEYLTSQPYLFANKFYYNYDPVTLQCLEEALNNRTNNPSESEKLPNFPVVNLVWQNQIADA